MELSLGSTVAFSGAGLHRIGSAASTIRRRTSAITRRRSRPCHAAGRTERCSPTGASTRATGHTAIYTPGSRLGGRPRFPQRRRGGRQLRTLLTNGDVMVEGNSGELYIWDGTNLTELGNARRAASMTVLPNGQILIGGSEVYNSTGTYQAAWQPTITTAPSSVTRGDTYQITGTQFNGLSQAGGGMGDEYQSSTNYPLIQITNNKTKHVFYAREHDPSTMGVATGSMSVTTSFDVPSDMDTGAARWW